MKRSLVTTGDGSHSLWAPEFDEHYHSVHGALQESLHVFMEMGWQLKLREAPTSLNVFEMGFGTGLNALLTLMEAERSQTEVQYTSIEKFPLSPEEAGTLNYGALIQEGAAESFFQDLHHTPWGAFHPVGAYFNLRKLETTLEDFEPDQEFNLIFFDAFAPNSQPELWTEAIFFKLFNHAAPGCVMTTYCAKGLVRRAMLAAGWEVEKVPGPPGKREMLRARRAK